MKKIFMTLMASMLLLSSTTYATENVNHRTHMVQKHSMSKKDMQSMFGTQKAKASTLDKNEMAKTEGEWFPLIYWAYLGFGAGFGATLYWGGAWK